MTVSPHAQESQGLPVYGIFQRTFRTHNLCFGGTIREHILRRGKVVRTLYRLYRLVCVELLPAKVWSQLRLGFWRTTPDNGE